jgi:hypothetical protein
MRRPRRPILAGALTAIVALAMSASIALGAVTFDPATAQGYVAKSDVQAAFSWKDQTVQANASRISFHLVQRVSASWSCVVNGVIQPMLAEFEATSPVASALATTPGKRGKPALSGFSLTGFAAGGGPASAIVPSCGSGSPANVTSGETDVLFADFQGQSRQIWSR